MSELKTEVMRLRRIIIDVDESRQPYNEKLRGVFVPATPMLSLVHEARDIRLQEKPYEGKDSLDTLKEGE